MSARHINFMSIPVADQDRAIAFYRDHLGFSVALDAPYAEGWRWIFLAPPEGATRLHFARRDELRWQEGMPALVLVSDDVDADAARLSGAGVTIQAGPDDSPWASGARFLMIRDSEDNVVLLESGSTV